MTETDAEWPNRPPTSRAGARSGVIAAIAAYALAVLALAKTLRGLQGSAVVDRRLHQAA